MGRAGSVSLFAAISLVLHLAWVVWMPELERPAPPQAHWVEMTFEAQPEVAAVPALPEASETQPSEAEPQPAAAHAQPSQQAQLAAATIKPRERAQPSAAKPAKSRTPIEPSRIELAQPEAAPTSEPAAPAHPQPTAAASSSEGSELPQPAAASSGAAKQTDLLPRAAALSLDAFARASALRCGTRAAAGPNDCEPSEAETGQAAQAALSRDLNAVASHVPHLQKREHPVLKRRSDGSYAYEGGVFEAVVRPDGKVEFRDTSIRGELRPSWVPLVVVADLNDLVERDVLGRELYSAEKQWLLDETRELREKLAGEARRRELLDANRALERTLHGIVDDQALSVAQKHEAIFLLWQDCGEDAQAKAHRQAVDSFVRRYMPQASKLAFRPEELATFNNTRPRLQPFNPYPDT